MTEPDDEERELRIELMESRLYKCNICNAEKPRGDFHLKRKTKRGIAHKCKACTSAYDAEKYIKAKEAYISRAGNWNKANPERRRANYLWAAYALSHDDYVALLAKQGGVCAICGAGPGRRALDIDHNKETRAIRGILCNTHNQGIGLFGHDPAMLMAAITYLERSNGPR